MLIDVFIPDYDFTEVHAISIQASAEDILQAAREVTHGDPPPPATRDD